MPTSTIGTGRDYSLTQTWEDAIPADVVAANVGVYEGRCCNDFEFTAALTIAAHTTDATRYIKLTAAATHSFQDHADVRTNPQFYNQAKGVGIKAPGGTSTSAITVTTTQYTRIERLQLTRVGTGYEGPVLSITSSNNCSVKDCLIGVSGVGVADHVIVSGGASAITNCLIYDVSTGSNTAYALSLIGAFAVLNCTIVNGRGTPSGRGIDLIYGAGTINNTAVFGWTTNVNGSTVNSGDYNATDAASFPGGGSNNQLSKTYANQFVSTTADYRLKAGADCIDHGNTNASLAPNDISGFTRGTTTAGDIGAWEYGSSAPPLVQYYLGADVTDGNWTKNTGGNTDLFSAVDDATPDTTGTDYIQSGVNPTADACELRFIGVQTPSAGTDHSVSYIIKRDNNTQLKVELINNNGSGDKIVKTWTHTGAGGGGDASSGATDASWTRYDKTFTPADGVGIADYSDLRLRPTAG